MPENHARNPEPRHEGAADDPAVPASEIPGDTPAAAAPAHRPRGSGSQQAGKPRGNPLLGWLKEIATVVVTAGWVAA